MQHWYVVHAKVWQERLVGALLEERWRLTVYLPEVLQPRAGRVAQAPLFPGYLFVLVDLDQTPASALNATPGVLRLVTFGKQPQPVSAAVVEALRDRVDELNANGGLPNHPFRPGDAVRLVEGPLCGLEAVFVGPMRPAQRVRVLLRFMGELSEVTLPAATLEPAAVAASRRERRTRGHGRRIRSTVGRFGGCDAVPKSPKP